MLLFIVNANTYFPEKKLKFFSEKGDLSDDIYRQINPLTVYSFHIYEWLKFVLRSINGHHRESYLTNLFHFEQAEPTRLSVLDFLQEPPLKKKLKKPIS